MTIPKGSAIIALGPLTLLVDEEVVARHVTGGTLHLCDNCPCYHVTGKTLTGMLSGASLDLRTKPDDVDVSPEIAERINAAMKGKPE